MKLKPFAVALTAFCGGVVITAADSIPYTLLGKIELLLGLFDATDLDDCVGDAGLAL